jgi:PAS domain S-box-containing protein
MKGRGDMNEHKQPGKGFSEPQELLQSMFINSPIGVFIVQNRNFQLFNPEFQELTGYSRDELLVMDCLEHVSPEDRNVVRENAVRMLKGERLSPYEYRFTTKGGKVIWVMEKVIPGQFRGKRATLGYFVDITEQRRLRENIQFYIAEITRYQEEERERIARELHDETAQALASLSLDISAITKAKERLSGETVKRLEQLQAKVDSIMEGVRRFAHELRPDVLDRLGLMSALELLADELNQGAKINARVEVNGTARRLSPQLELVLFRIAQEALRNVKKHSEATEAVVRVEFTAKQIKLNVTDNGIGFELPEVLSDFAGESKLGLIGMQERARLLDGSFSVESQPGRGTTITVEVVG